MIATSDNIRQRLHHLAPEGEGSAVPEAEFAAERAAVTAIWDATFKTGP